MPPRKRAKLASAAFASSDMHSPSMSNEVVLRSVLLQGFLGNYWMDIARLRLVCKLWGGFIWKNMRCVDARCLGIVGDSEEFSMASCLLAKIPLQLESLEWLELDYCSDKLSPPLAVRKGNGTERLLMESSAAESALEMSAVHLHRMNTTGKKSFWPNLRCLSLRGIAFPLTDNDVYLITASCADTLVVLDLSRTTPVTDASEECLRNYGGIRLSLCTNLRFLDLAMNNYIGDEALFHICVSCSELRALGLAGCQGVTAQGVHFIRKMLWRTLEVLDISNLTSLTDESLVDFATGNLKPMTIMDADVPLPKYESTWEYSSDTPHPGWISLWCLLASFLPNVKQTTSVVALIGMPRCTLTGQTKKGSTSLKILECRGFRGGDSNVDEEAYIEAKDRGVACLFTHQDQDDLKISGNDRLAVLQRLGKDVARVKAVWPPSMLTFRPTQYGKDHFSY